MTHEERLKEFKKMLVDCDRSFEYVRARLIADKSNGIDYLTKQEYSMIWHNTDGRFYSPKGETVIDESFKIIRKEMKM